MFDLIILVLFLLLLLIIIVIGIMVIVIRIMVPELSLLLFLQDVARLLGLSCLGHLRKDLSKHLENIFGLGHARHLDRAVSTFLGLQFLSCKTQLGTRRIVYLAGVPERLTQKFKQFYAPCLTRHRFFPLSCCAASMYVCSRATYVFVVLYHVQCCWGYRQRFFL